jgi:2-dehydropantoate 2-reductase
MRILVFGAGVIGSLYSLRFMRAGLDVTVLARGGRLDDLRKNGLRYREKDAVRAAPVKVIERLREDDIYDFIFVPVRLDQMTAALSAIRDNRSENILTLTNTTGYDAWTAIVGGRLIPGFPGAGGNIEDGVLWGQFGKKVQGTIFGEINGERTGRIERLARLFEIAGLPYEISENILAFHLSHAAFAATIKYFYTPNGIMDAKTAKGADVLYKVAEGIQQNVRLLEQAGIPILDPKTKLAGKLPRGLIVALFRLMLSLKFTRSVLLGNHALAAREENLQMGRAFAGPLRGPVSP